MANFMPGEMGGLPAEYYPQMQDTSRQLKMAELLKQQGMTSPEGKMVSGHYVAPSITQYLAQALNAYQGNKKEQAANDKQAGMYKDYQTKQETAAQKLAEMLKPQVDPMQSEMPSENPDGSTSYGPTPTQMQDPSQTLSAIQQYYAMGGNNQQMAGAAMEQARFGQQDQMRQDTLDFQRETLQSQQQAAAQARQEAREQRMQELQLRAQDARVTAQERAELQKEMFRMQQEGRLDLARLGASLRPAPAAPSVTPATIMRNGKQVIVDARTGREIGEAPSAGYGKPMSSVAQKELIETDEQIQGGQAAKDLFKQAQAINDKAMGFRGAGTVAAVGSMLPESIRPESVDATSNLDNILQSAALPQLKAIFGGMPTEGERAILLDVQGSSSKSPAVRKQIFDRATKAIDARLRFAQDKAKSLRTGSYFAGDGGVDPVGQAAPQAAPAATQPKVRTVDW